MPEDGRTPHFALRLDEEDRGLLDAVASREKLTKSDILRRGLREYAARLGIKIPKTKNN